MFRPTVNDSIFFTCRPCYEFLNTSFTLIRLLGKKNSKHSEGDYVQRAWRTVFEDSLSKDVNWLGRRDKRVNGGMGKKGINSCRITELVRGNHFIQRRDISKE